MSTPPTMIIADDHPMLREGLKEHLGGAGGFNVVGTVGDAQSAVNLCRERRPDVLLLDVEMPGRDSLGAMGDIKAASPGTRIVIFTAFCRDSIIEVAVRGGAAGYLLKSDLPAAIVEALSQIVRGHRVFSREVSNRMSLPDGISRWQSGAGVTPLSGLTPRELEVLRYIGRGWDNHRMAETMHLSKRTVERHVFRLMEAMTLHDRAGLAKFAHDHHLVE